MAIIMPSEMNNLFVKTARAKKIALLAFTGSIALVNSSYLSAAGLNVNASAKGEIVSQEIAPQSGDELSLTTLTITPTVNATYTTRTIEAVVNGSVNYLERDADQGTLEDTFAQYDYDVRWTPLDSLLVIQASGGQQYQNANAINFLSADFLLNAQNLAKINNNRIATTLQVANGDYVRGSGTLAYNDVDASPPPEGVPNNFAIDNTTLQANGVLRNGDNAKRYFWEVSGDYQNTQQDQNFNNASDFKTRRANAKLDIMLLNGVALRLNAAHEANEFGNRVASVSNKQEFDSVGVGLTLRQSQNRFVSLSANTVNSDDEDDGDTFVGLDMQWAFSNRTNMTAMFGRRVFGDTANVSLNYNTKHFRSSITYTEDITNFARLVNNQVDLGVFVCPPGATGIGSCFQPDTLDYQLGPGEQVVAFTRPNVELSNSVLVLRNGSAQFGYSFSRVTLGLSLGYQENENLDLNQLIETHSAILTMSYRLGGYTYLDASVNYADIEQQSDLFGTGNNEVLTSNISIRHQVGPRLNTQFGFNYIDRTGDLAIGSPFGAEFTDKRLTFSLTYQFN